MNKTRVFLRSTLILLITISSLWLFSRDSVEKDDSSAQSSLRFREIESPEVEFLKTDINLGVKGRYPRFVRFFLQSVFGWSPEGEPHFFSEACSYEKISQIFYAKPSAGGQAQDLQSLLSYCDKEWSTGSSLRLWNAARGLALKYDLENRAHLQNVMFHLPGGIKLRALLALKDRKARPIVIIRNGIFSSIAEFWPERSFLIHLFEQSPFHLLIVENMTSPDYIANNKHLGLGGFDEGLQNIWLANLFKDSRQGLSKLVSEVHVAGISLGGNGVLFSSLINQVNSAEHNSLISSFTALCPVVDLKKAVEHLSQNNFKASLVDFWASRRLAGLQKQYPDLQTRSWFAPFSFKSEFLPNAIAKIGKDYRFNELVTVARIPTSLEMEDLWSASDFAKAFPELNSNLLILGTKYDPAVPWAEQSGRFPQLNRVLFDKGVHCTLDVPYDWKVIGTILQSRILSQSKSGSFKYDSIDFEMGEEFQNAFLGRGQILKMQIDQQAKTFTFVLQFQEQIKDKWKVFSPTQNISMASDIYDGDLNWPLSPADQLMLRRWFHQNLRLKVDRKTGKNVLHFEYPHWQNRP